MTSVAMLLMHDMRLATMFQPSTLPCTVLGCRTMGPTPCALTMHHTKKVMPAMGTTTAFTVKRWRLRDRQPDGTFGQMKRADAHILWMGNQIAGREMSQKRKKHMKSFVSVPEDAGKWFANPLL